MTLHLPRHAAAALVAGCLALTAGCEDEYTNDYCVGHDLCSRRSNLPTCTSEPPWHSEEGKPLPSCVAGMGQVVGYGRCETDADCAAAFRPEWVDPEWVHLAPPRCVVLEPTGERFCERFSWTIVGPGGGPCQKCIPGYPCGPGGACDMDCTRRSPWTTPGYYCHRQITRTTADGEPLAYLDACVPGEAEPYLDPYCEPGASRGIP